MSVETRPPSRLEAAAKKLQDASVSFNTRLARLERAILDTRIEIEAGVPLQPIGMRAKMGEAPPGVLHYAKHRQSGQWALIVSTSTQQYWPLLEAPRPLRVAAVDAMPTLVRQLEQAAIALADQLVAGEPKIDAAVTLVESIVWPEPVPDVVAAEPTLAPRRPQQRPGEGGVIFVDDQGQPLDPSTLSDVMFQELFGGRRRGQP